MSDVILHRRIAVYIKIFCLVRRFGSPHHDRTSSPIDLPRSRYLNETILPKSCSFIPDKLTVRSR